MMKLPVWDVKTLHKMVGDDGPTQCRMLAQFLCEAEKQVSVIVRAAADGELALVVDLVHMLKTSARMVGALQIGQLCEEIETAGKTQEPARCYARAELLSAVFFPAQLQIRNHMAASVPP